MTEPKTPATTAAAKKKPPAMANQADSRVTSRQGWKHPDPIKLPGGRQFVTLKDAYTMKLPKAEQHIAEWQAATKVLIMAAGNC